MTLAHCHSLMLIDTDWFWFILIDTDWLNILSLFSSAPIFLTSNYFRPKIQHALAKQEYLIINLYQIIYFKSSLFIIGIITKEIRTHTYGWPHIYIVNHFSNFENLDAFCQYYDRLWNRCKGKSFRGERTHSYLGGLLIFASRKWFVCIPINSNQYAIFALLREASCPGVAGATIISCGSIAFFFSKQGFLTKM